MDETRSNGHAGTQGIRGDLELMAAIFAPIVVATLFFMTSRWLAYLSVMSVVLSIWAGLRRGEHGGLVRSPRIAYFVQIALMCALTGSWAVVVTAMILLRTPPIDIAAAILLFSWICLGYGWAAGWLIKLVIGRSAA